MSMNDDEAAATVTPADHAVECDEEGCTTGELLARVDPGADRRARILCPRHRVEYLREVTQDE